MYLDISVKLGHVNDVSIGRVLGGFEDEKGGAGITSSEMRHAVRMGDDTTVIRV